MIYWSHDRGLHLVVLQDGSSQSMHNANMLYCTSLIQVCWRPRLSELDSRQLRPMCTKGCLTVQKPSGFSTFHFILLIFHIQASAVLWPNVFAWVAGIWMRVCIYPFTWMSVGSSSKQYTSAPESSPLLPSLSSKLPCYREGGLTRK